MKIIEKDCYIEYINGIYHLYFLKNKKELKEDNENTHKISGYFLTIDSAFKEIIKFRQHKKYPFKETWKSEKLMLNKYKLYKQNFKDYLCQIYNPIKKWRKELFVYEEVKSTFWNK